MPESSCAVHHRTCTLCEAMCGIEIRHRETEILSIRGDREDPFSRGHVCPKAVALQDIQNDPDRLRKPLRRNGDDWEEISWEEAFDITARELRAVQARHGNNAVGLYYGNPTVHNLGAMLFAPPFARALKTRNKFSATSADQLPHHVAALAMFGHQLMLPIPDIDRTRCFVVMGGNPLASNGSLMTAPDIRHRLRDLQRRGGRLIVIDPRRTETAEVADRHLPIRPGTDALLLLALLHTIFREGLDRPGPLAAFSDGMDRLRAAVEPWSPNRVAGHTGIAAKDIQRLAREFALADGAVFYGRLGASTQEFGGLCQWLINCINVVTGNCDRPGGAMFTTPAIDVLGVSGKAGFQGYFGNRRSRVRKLPNFSGEFPVATLADEILTPGDGQIRAMVVHAGNPVLSTPNGTRLEKGLAGLEFMVAIDYYINETTRHADIILPPTSALEHSHYDLIFHTIAIRNTAKYSPPLFEPHADARHDWEIFMELTRRLQGGVAARSVPGLGLLRAGLRRLAPPERFIDVMLRAGPWGLRRADGPRLSLQKLRDNPHGIDLGPMQPCLPQRLFTADRRIHLAPDLFVTDLDRLYRRFPASTRKRKPAGFDLRLIGRRHIRSNNSWQHNSHRLVKGPDRCTILMHPEDAARRGITDRDRVRVTSRVGSIELPAEVSDGIMPGVISIPHGWGHHRKGIRLGIAAEHAGESLNDLTDEQMIDELTGNAAFNGVPVRAEPVA